jgi:PhzF family phenazine biosynthesis protein
MHEPTADLDTGLRQYVVDAFTDRPFAGNPAAIVLLDAAAPTEWLQALAAENNLSETAYLVPEDGGWGLRWFTPDVEVALCGHATLASAHVLAVEEGVTDPELRFQTLSGELRAQVAGDGWITLDFPNDEPTPIEPPAPLVECLRVDPADVVRAAQARTKVLIELPSADAVLACQPDFRAMASEIEDGVIITAAGDDAIAAEVGAPVDFVSRFFAPGSGIDEDPVTGSAHCVLAPYWAAAIGRDELLGVQVSARRGVVRVAVRGDRVTLTGQAVTVNRARLAMPAPAPADR